jgi:helix-turn-helix protein
MLGGAKKRSAAETWAVHSIQRAWHNAAWLTLANRANTIQRMKQCQDRSDKDTSAGPIDPRAFGLAKAAYAVGETLDLLSICRTSLYAAVKRGDLKRVKFGKKTLFYAADLASFLTKLGHLSEADKHRVGHARDASKGIERS